MNFKKWTIGVVGALVALYLIGFLIPNKYRIVREANIVAAPKMIFAFAGDLSRWKEWTTWAKMDPNMQYDISSPSYGIGATQKWKSEKMGEGSVVITQWAAEDVISYDLNFGDFPQSHASLRMTPQPQGAMVTWTFDGETGKGSLQRWFGLLMRFFLNRDLSASLENLRKLCESTVAADIKSPWHEAGTAQDVKGKHQDAKAGAKKTESAKPEMKSNEPPAILPMPGRQQPVPRNIKTH